MESWFLIVCFHEEKTYLRYGKFTEYRKCVKQMKIWRGVLPLKLPAGHLDHHLQWLTIQVTMQEFKMTCRWSNDFVHDKYPLFLLQNLFIAKRDPCNPLCGSNQRPQTPKCQLGNSKPWNQLRNCYFTFLRLRLPSLLWSVWLTNSEGTFSKSRHCTYKFVPLATYTVSGRLWCKWRTKTRSRGFTVFEWQWNHSCQKKI